MREASLDDARKIIAQAGRMASEDAIGFLLAHYDSSTQPARDALVIALIGDLVAAQQFAAFRAGQNKVEAA